MKPSASYGCTSANRWFRRFTFLIANRFFGKAVKDQRKHRKMMRAVFSGFAMTFAADAFLTPVFDSRFIDLEGAAQYRWASQAEANLIATKDAHDFFAPKIPVIRPHDFVNLYNDLI